MKLIKFKNKKFLTVALTLTMGLFSSPAFSVTVDESVRNAILTHPDVQASWHSFKAAEYEQKVSKSGFMPKVDISAAAGWESLDGEGYSGKRQYDYVRDGAYLTLSQLVFDGGLTSNQIKKLNHAKFAKYYDLMSSMEKMALLAFRSHEDVARYRRMVVLARENLLRHQEIYNKIETGFKAGVESSVNRDIAKGRLALAQSNLIIDEGNLHDATTQYFRTVSDDVIVGDLEEAYITVVTPPTHSEALDSGLPSNPRYRSVEQSVQSTKYALGEQRSRLAPRIDIRGGLNFEHDVDGDIGRRDKAMIELVIRYNLFDGGADRDNIRRFTELYEQSEAILKKTEREVAQSLLVSYNDIFSISRQIEHLEQHRKSAESMELAYRQQYEVGKRSLLDLLDSQNEYFQAKRAHINALFNLEIAKAAYLSEVGGLVKFFRVQPKNVPTPEELGIKSVAEKKE